MYHISIIRSLVEGHLDCFHFLAVVSRAAANMVEQVSVEYDVKSFRYTAGNDVAGLYGRFTFSFLRILHTDF